jgi:hypothetical protein
MPLPNNFPGLDIDKYSYISPDQYENCIECGNMNGLNLKVIQPPEYSLFCGNNALRAHNREW